MVSFLHLKARLVRELQLLVPYTGSGVTGFLLDVGLFWVLLVPLGVHYLIATVLGFVFGTTVHFLLSRFFVFKHTTRSTHTAYAYFLVVTLSGLAVISTAMFCAVDLLEFDPTRSRVFIGILVGTASFFLHKRISFRYHSHLSTPL